MRKSNIYVTKNPAVYLTGILNRLSHCVVYFKINMGDCWFILIDIYLRYTSTLKALK